jgi:hypothetical protein
VKSRTFQKGSGCFKCSSCGRLTRHTTSDNPDICGPCYELAGFENGVTDNGVDHIAGYLSLGLNTVMSACRYGVRGVCAFGTLFTPQNNRLPFASCTTPINAEWY